MGKFFIFNVISPYRYANEGIEKPKSAHPFHIGNHFSERSEWLAGILPSFPMRLETRFADFCTHIRRRAGSDLRL